MFRNCVKMKTVKAWKQPTPVDIRNNPNIDLLTRLIFLDILNGCRNANNNFVYHHGKYQFNVTLKRGQFLMKTKDYCRELQIPYRRLRLALETLSKHYSPMKVERKQYGLVITFLDYEHLVSLKTPTQFKTQLGMQLGNNLFSLANTGTNGGRQEANATRDATRDATRTYVYRVNKKNNTKKDFQEEMKKVLEVWNQVHGTRRRSYRVFEQNYSVCREDYSFQEIATAIRNLPYHKHFGGSMDIAVFFKPTNRYGEEVDYIATMLEVKVPRKPKQTTPQETVRQLTLDEQIDQAKSTVVMHEESLGKPAIKGSLRLTVERLLGVAKDQYDKLLEQKSGGGGAT